MTGETQVSATEQAGGKRLWKPGESGNPGGRPKGSKHKTTLALEAMLEGEAEAITRKAIELAKGGDLTAIRLCLDRLLPVRRDRHVSFEAPEIRTAKDAADFAGVLLNKTAAGKLVENYVRAIETSDIDKRLSELEQQNRRKG